MCSTPWYEARSPSRSASERRRQADQRDHRASRASVRGPAPAQRPAGGGRAAAIAPSVRASCIGSLRLGQRALDERDDGERLGQPRDAAHAGHAVERASRSVGLRPDATLISPVLRAHRGGPVRRAVHEQAVAQRHAAEPELLVAHASMLRLRDSCDVGAAARPRSLDRDALVRAVDQRCRLEHVHLPLREEAVGDAVGERLAEPARVGEAGQHGGRDRGPGSSAATKPRMWSISAVSIGERLPHDLLVEGRS